MERRTTPTGVFLCLLFIGSCVREASAYRALFPGLPTCAQSASSRLVANRQTLIQKRSLIVPAMSTAISPSLSAPGFSSSVITCTSPLWLDAATLASLSGISELQARQVLSESVQGQLWHGSLLQVRTAQASHASMGPHYEVHADSLPPELYRNWFQQHLPPTLASPHFSNVLSLGTGPQPLDRQAIKHRELALWKWHLIQPALACPKHSAARGEQLRHLALSAHATPDGRRRHVSLDSLYSWVARYEEQGITALMRRPR